MFESLFLGSRRIQINKRNVIIMCISQTLYRIRVKILTIAFLSMFLKCIEQFLITARMMFVVDNKQHFIVFISYIDTHRIFQGQNEFMIQFYISGVSFVAKYNIYISVLANKFKQC